MEEERRGTVGVLPLSRFAISTKFHRGSKGGRSDGGGPPRGPPLASFGDGSRKRQKTQVEPTLKIQFHFLKRKNFFESFLKTKFEKMNRKFKASFQKKNQKQEKSCFQGTENSNRNFIRKKFLFFWKND